MIRKIFLSFVVSAILMAVSFTHIHAQSIQLTYGSLWPPPPHPMSVADTHWIEKIEKESQGKVKIKPYWAGTMTTAKEGPMEVANNVVDMAYAPVGYMKSGFELTKAQEPFYQGAKDVETKIRIFWQVWDKFPEMKNEFSDYKLIVIGSSGEPPFHLMTTKPVGSLADLKGMRIKAPPCVISTLKRIGAEGLIMSMSEVIESLQKGIIQGVFAPSEVYKSMKFSDFIKYDVTNLALDFSPSPFRIMSMSTWEKLPKDIQKLIEDNKIWWSLEHGKELIKVDDVAKQFAREAGVQYVQLPQSDEKKFLDIYHEETIKANNAMDAKGIPATKYFEEIQRLIKETSGKK
jgi:TRAP-type C4-dicarboxylate transport system substrate-binding protein